MEKFNKEHIHVMGAMLDVFYVSKRIEVYIPNDSNKQIEISYPFGESLNVEELNLLQEVLLQAKDIVTFPVKNNEHITD